MIRVKIRIISTGLPDLLIWAGSIHLVNSFIEVCFRTNIFSEIYIMEEGL